MPSADDPYPNKENRMRPNRHFAAVLAATAMLCVDLTTGEVRVTLPTATAGQGVVAAWAGDFPAKAANAGIASPRQGNEATKDKIARKPFISGLQNHESSSGKAE